MFHDQKCCAKNCVWEQAGNGVVRHIIKDFFVMKSSSGQTPPPRESPEADTSTTPLPKKLIELAKKLQRLIDNGKRSSERHR